MRQIKCRGWSPDLKRWVYGAYYEHCNCAVCISNDDKPEYHEAKIVFEEIMDWSFPYKTMVADVIRESVGEFACKSKGGNEFYEGDIVSYMFNGEEIRGVIKFGMYEQFNVGFYVEWCDGYSLMRQDLGYWEKKDIRVIGNTYETPELLQEVKDGKTEE